jgi:2-keto-4-pentenoate hydratase
MNAPGKILRAAEILANARNAGQKLTGLPDDVAPTSEDEAFAVQREVMRLLGLSVGGWKCAAPPGKPQSGAPMPASGFQQSPARQPFRADEQIGVEGEIALRLGADLPGRADGKPYTRGEVLAAVAAAMPAIELVSSRFVDMRAVPPLVGMADSIAHFAFIHGDEAPGWRSLDLSRLRVRLDFAGEVQVEQVGGNPSGDPLSGVVWLANRLIGSGTHLRAGEIITTGSCTGLIFTSPDKPVTVAFEGLGSATVELVGACPFGFG